MAPMLAAIFRMSKFSSTAAAERNASLGTKVPAIA
jgi:hypothetical protein